MVLAAGFGGAPPPLLVVPHPSIFRVCRFLENPGRLFCEPLFVVLAVFILLLGLCLFFVGLGLGTFRVLLQSLHPLLEGDDIFLVI